MGISCVCKNHVHGSTWASLQHHNEDCLTALVNQFGITFGGGSFYFSHGHLPSTPFSPAPFPFHPIVKFVLGLVLIWL